MKRGGLFSILYGMKHMKRFFIFICTLGLLGVSAQAQRLTSPFYTQLKSKMAGSVFAQKNPGLNRLAWMRYYPVSNRVVEPVGTWERIGYWFDSSDTVSAMAGYLYQMYISASVYGATQAPARLDENYFGALDAFEHMRDSFNVQDSLDFYRSHKKEIKARLANYFSQARLPKYNADDLKNDYVEAAFLNTLKNSAGKNGRAGFTLARAKWTASIPAQEKAFFKKYMQASLQELSRQVVLYEENAASLDVLDKTAGRYNSSSKQYLYRPATDECAACTYASCRKICRAVVGRKNARSASNLRLYEITMRPQKGEYLAAADGKTNFISPDGKKYPQWQYHAAALAVARRDGKFVPVVIDKFLFKEPAEFSAWLKKFDAKTSVMYLKPFRLRAADEKRLVSPDGRKGKNIVKDGRTYTPYPVGK